MIDEKDVQGRVIHYKEYLQSVQNGLHDSHAREVTVIPQANVVFFFNRKEINFEFNLSPWQENFRTSGL